MIQYARQSIRARLLPFIAIVAAVLLGAASFCGLVPRTGTAAAGPETARTGAALHADSSAAVLHADSSAAASVPVAKWLVLGPVACPFPAFNEGPSPVKGPNLLEYEHIPVRNLKPAPGGSVAVAGTHRAEWRTVEADTLGIAIQPDKESPSIAYCAAYIEVPRWMKVKIEAASSGLFDVTIDGSSVLKQKAAPESGVKKGSKTETVKLEQGKHLMIVKGVYVPGDTLADWRINVTLSPDKDVRDLPRVSLDPSRGMTVADVLDVPAIRNIAVSPDGAYAALAISKRTAPEGDSENWMEIRSAKTGALFRTFKDSEGSNWHWAPSGNRLSYSVIKEEKGTIRVLDLDSNTSETIIENIKDFSGYQWSPDGTFIVYSVNKPAEKDEAGIKRLRGVSDRRHYGRDTSYLFAAPVPAGMTRRLTAGEYTSYVYDIHPDARSLLIGRSYENPSERPYDLTELLLLDIEDQRAEVLWKGHWLNGAQWSPDGRAILILGGPSAFGETGVNVPEGAIPNDYDTQAYLFDPGTKTVEPITKNFDPAIQSAFWPRPGSDIFFVAEEGEYVRLYRYNIKAKSFKNIPLGFDVMHERDAARDKAATVAIGSGATQPWRLYAIDLAKGRSAMIFDPCREQFEHVRLEKVEEWSFTARNGKIIAGRIHYPLDFDPSKKWPCIVYYYGGTSPVDRSFGTRYPKNLWAAAGYVVYVLQPSGATGFGQAFSAAHVNDWGKTTADEIIEGARQFLAAHDFVDSTRVGCIGASFGGFMTQLLITKTDMFAAAVSHAGISSITSYWGEGYWGYEYNAVSAANSFPWNRRDIYVDQSPLFFADKVTTPLLLLHGASDTNVPPGESEQMYTALKLLGKEVEYIKFAGQDHFILDYKKRIAWSNAIVAWFDKWLKHEPEWWNDLYPPLAAGAAAEPAALGMHRVRLEKYGSVLLGSVTRKDIDAELGGWSAEYAGYAPDSSVIADLKERIGDVKITCILGTWCGDSKREVPRLWKILDAAGFAASQLTLLAVGSSRFSPDMPIPKEAFDWSNAVKTWHKVTAVPTIVVTRGGAELGRIVETPNESLEKDLLSIIGR